MKKKTNLKLMTMGVLLASMVACTGNKAGSTAKADGCPYAQCQCPNQKDCPNTQGARKAHAANCPQRCNNLNTKNNNAMKYSKKYTNADFYKDGKFDQQVAMEAMKDMFEFYGVPFTDLMAKDMWVTDFGLGDFENVGMGGIFWINDPEYGYFAHAIYLLPGQMIPEHAHVKTKFPAKHESWMVEKGWVYNFSVIGEETPNAPAIPATHGPIKSKNFVVQNVGDVLRLKELETFHFMMAGPEGAIVDEWACYHDNDGLRFTNPKASL